MMKKTGYLVIVAAYILFLSSSACAWHWTPPTETNFWEAVYGYLTGFTTLDAGDEIAAFRVSDDIIAGICYISESGGDFTYSMYNVYGDDTTPFDVYFLVWDGSTELSAIPNFTVHPAYDPGSGPTQHNMERGVPEPSTIIIMCTSVFLIHFFILKQRLAMQKVS